MVVMKRFYLFTLPLLMAIFLSLPAIGQAAEKSAPLLCVSGHGSAQGAPDQASLSLGITSSAPTAEDAQRKTNAAVQELHKALLDFGLDAADMKTESYNFYPQYEYHDQAAATIKGYTVSYTLRVHLNDLKKAGQLIDLALSSGANQVNDLTFSIHDTSAMRHEALQSALRDAREKADIIAATLGYQVIDVQNITETAPFISPNHREMLSRDMAMNHTPIEAGTLTLTTAIEVTFLLGK